jgi:hypothetical protein
MVLVAEPRRFPRSLIDQMMSGKVYREFELTALRQRVLDVRQIGWSPGNPRMSGANLA